MSVKSDVETATATTPPRRDSHEKGDYDAGVLAASSESYGVLKAEGAAGVLSRTWKIALFGCLALAAYTISLDQYTSGSYEVASLSTEFGYHSLIATVNVVTGVFAAVAQPPFAKLCDIVGRYEAFCFSAFMYTLGYIVTASAQSVGAFAAGQCIYQFGLTGFWLIAQIIIADNTALKSRVFWAISPSILGTINVWLSGNIAASLLGEDQTNWRWGFGMFCILMPVLLSPVIGILAYSERKARKQGLLDQVVSPWRTGRPAAIASRVFWQMDFIGLFLMTAAFTLLLVPITIYSTVAGGWKSARVIVPFVLGCILVPIYFVYEGIYAPHPIVPPSLFKRRSIISGFGISFFFNVSDGIAGNYLYTWYQVAANQSVLSATRLSGLSVFCATIAIAISGLLIMKVKRNKPFMVAGSLLQTLMLGLMCRFRGPENTVGELATLQVFRGIGYGILVWPTQSNIQASVKHEQVAIVTAAFLALYYLSGGVGSAIGGAIWQATLPGRLQESIGQPELAASVFSDPITFITEYPLGTPERQAVINAYSAAQRILLITATCISGIVIGLTLLADNYKLGDTITLAEFEHGKSVMPGAMTGDAARDSVNVAVSGVQAVEKARL